MPAKSGGGSSSAGVGAGGTVCSDSVVDSDWAFLVSSTVDGLGEASNASNVDRGSRLECACRATGVAGESPVVASGDAGETLRVAFAGRGTFTREAPGF